MCVYVYMYERLSYLKEINTFKLRKRKIKIKVKCKKKNTIKTILFLIILIHKIQIKILISRSHYSIKDN